MTAEVSWERLQAITSTTREPDRVPAEKPQGPFAFLASGEEWVTFSLVVVAFMAVVSSLHSANWVNEMPSLLAASAIGLVSAWLLAHTPLPALLLHVFGLALGAVTIVGQTMHTMRLEDPLLSSGLRARWSELWLRVGDWARALVAGDISTDPLPFVLMMVFVAWGVSYLGAWSVFRWRNAWVALVPGGITLLTNISYLPGQPAAEFIIFLFAAMLLVTRMHYLRALRQWREQHTWRPPYLAVEVLSYVTWLGLALIVAAWFIPTANNWGLVADRWRAALEPVTDRVERIGRVFIGVDAKRGTYPHAFGDVLPLQGAVTLDNENVLLEVIAPEPLYVRGAVYDEYSAQGWKISGASARDLSGTSVEAASFGTVESRGQFRRAVVAEITVVESVAPRRLFTIGDPLAADVDARLLTGETPNDIIGLVPDDRVRAGETYRTVGTISVATPEQLLSSGYDYPQWVRDRYLQLPADLPLEVRELAQAWTGGETQPYAVVNLIASRLRAEYPVDFAIPDRPPRMDGVSYFLFDLKRGYFDLHASAMAVLLRTLGIPTRVATGFVLADADLDSGTKAYAVTERRAWAWPEVYFEGFGWVDFNPTSAQPRVARPGADIDYLSSVGLGAEEDLFPELTPEELADLELLEGSSPFTGFAVESTAGRIGRIVVAAITAVVIAASVLATLALAVRALWAYWFRGLGPATGRWARLQLLISWAGVRAESNRTALESVELLEALIDDRDREVRPLALAFTRERYGGGAPEVDDEAAEEEEESQRGLYAGARNALLWRVVQRWLGMRRRQLAWREHAAGRSAG